MARASRLLGLAAAVLIAGASIALAAFAGDGKQKSDFGGPESARAVALQEDRRLVLVGASTFGGPDFDFLVARYTKKGVLDLDFDADGFREIELGGFDGADDVAIQDDGGIVVVGDTGNTIGVARLKANGTPDNTFSDDGMRTVDFANGASAAAVAIQDNGRIVVAGSEFTGQQNFALARLKPSGKLDRSFSGNGKQSTNFGGFDGGSDVAIQDNGRIVVAGDTDPGMVPDAGNFALARYLPDGRLDGSFSGNGKAVTNFGGSDAAQAIALDRGGRVVACGSRSKKANLDFAIARYRTNGGLDHSFSKDGRKTLGLGGGDESCDGVAIQRNGRIVAGGDTEDATPTLDWIIARLTPKGKFDNTFGDDGVVITDFEGQGDALLDLVMQTRRKIVGVGAANPGSDFALARYLRDGELDD